jgi:archaetidylinositol phosphate synthase
MNNILSHNTSTSMMTPLDRWLQTKGVALLPLWCGTRLLTLLTLPISMSIVVFCWMARLNAPWLWAVSLLIASQYVTDTLDGAVGRARSEGYVRWGYYMDHFLDYVFLCSLVVGYALMVPTAALWFVGIAAVMAGFMVNTFLLVAATNEFKIVFYGIGPTESRIAFIVLNSIVAIKGSGVIVSALPWVLGTLSVMLAVFVYRCQKRLSKVDVNAKNSAPSRHAFSEHRTVTPSATGVHQAVGTPVSNSPVAYQLSGRCVAVQATRREEVAPSLRAC